jgi:hypothetical protein
LAKLPTEELKQKARDEFSKTHNILVNVVSDRLMHDNITPSLFTELKMSNETNTESKIDFAQEILGSTSPAVVGPEPPITPASPSDATVGNPPAFSQESGPTRETAGAARTPNTKYPGLGTKWKESLEKDIPQPKDRLYKKYKAHMDKLAAGVPVEELDHFAFGISNACQHQECKERRYEFYPEEVHQVSNLPPPPALPSIIDEEIAGAILNVPNRLGEMFARIAKAPKEVIEVWKPDDKEIEAYGRYGKALEKEYLPQLDFKWRNLILVGIWYGMQLGGRAITTITIMKTQEAKK